MAAPIRYGGRVYRVLVWGVKTTIGGGYLWREFWREGPTADFRFPREAVH